MENYFLVHEDDQWKFQKQNSQRAIRNFETKVDAMDFAKDYMNNHGGSLKIQGINNKFQEERTYPKSSDPHKTKG